MPEKIEKTSTTILLMVISVLLGVIATVAIGGYTALDSKKLDSNVFEAHRGHWEEAIKEVKKGQTEQSQKLDRIMELLTQKQVLQK